MWLNQSMEAKDLTSLINWVHGVQLRPKVGLNQIWHRMGCREFMGPSQQRPFDLSVSLGLLVLARRLGVGLWLTHSRTRQNGWGCITKAAVMLSTLHFVLYLGERRTRLLFHWEVKHAGRHVVSHELDANLDATPFFPLLSWFGLQGIPARARGNTWVYIRAFFKDNYN